MSGTPDAGGHAPPPAVPAGDWPASRLFEALEAVLGGRVVRLEPDLDQRGIHLASPIPHTAAAPRQIELLLRAHGIFLFFAGAPDGVPLVYASRSSKPELPPSLTSPTEVVRVRNRAPSELVRRLRERVRPEEGPEPVTAVPIDRAGKIVLRSASRERLAAVAAWIRRHDAPAGRVVRYAAYPCDHTLAGDLRAKLLDRLEEEERAEVRIVPHAHSNTLMIRAPGALVERLLDLARRLDRPPGEASADAR